MAAEARRLGLRAVLVPRANAPEAAVVPGIEVLAADTLGQVVQGLRAGTLPVVKTDAEALFRRARTDDVDFSEVRGQSHVKRALEIAAAGGHNILMVGPPGVGENDARRGGCTRSCPKWGGRRRADQPHLQRGGAPRGRARRWWRPAVSRAAPHDQSMRGWWAAGSTPGPGEMTLSHNGVLFLDELPEFKRNVLELLRQPLEDGKVTIVRAAGAVTFPARFMLVGAMNPCPCGHLGDPGPRVSACPRAVERYRWRHQRAAARPFRYARGGPGGGIPGDGRDRGRGALRRHSAAGWSGARASGRAARIHGIYCNAQMGRLDTAILRDRRGSCRGSGTGDGRMGFRPADTRARSKWRGPSRISAGRRRSQAPRPGGVQLRLGRV